MNKKKEYKKPTMDAIQFANKLSLLQGMGSGNKAPQYSGDPDDDE